jgi:hypothetical protein
METLMDWIKKTEKSVVKKVEEATAKKDKQ